MAPFLAKKSSAFCRALFHEHQNGKPFVLQEILTGLKIFHMKYFWQAGRFLIKGKDQIRLDPQKLLSRPFGKFKSATNIGPLKLVVSRLIYSLRIPQKVF